MAQHEIVALRCPSCGSGITEPSHEKPFGAEFRCDVCGITSALIINRALLPLDALQKSGDQVCAVCGRVAKLDARFCQDGHKLVRQCVNYPCRKEFTAYHQRCDYCGWPQNVTLESPEGYDLSLDRAIADLSETVNSGGSQDEVRFRLGTIESLSRASGLGKKAVPSILDLLHNKKYHSTHVETQAWKTFTVIGADPVEAVPLLLQRIKESEQGWWFTADEYGFGFWIALAHISPREVLPLCRQAIEASGKNAEGYGYWLNSVLDVTRLVGNAAIPMLTEFTGVFSGERGTRCQDTIDRIMKGDVPRYF